MSDLDRNHFIDELRGFALLGIALVNAQGFAFPGAFYPRESYASDASEATVFLLLTLVSGKFFLLFSFLFGYSSQYILGTSSSLDGLTAPNNQRFKWRLFALCGLGIAHGTLLFFGDILAVYGVVGFVILYWVNRSDKIIIQSAIALFGVTFLLNLGFALTLPAVAVDIDPYFLNAFNSIGNDSWLATIGSRSAMWLSTWFAGILVYSGSVALMFALGFLCARHQWLSAENLARPFWQTVGKFAWLPALLACLYYAYETTQIGPDLALSSRGTAILSALHTVVAPVLTMAYVMWLWQLRQRSNSSLLWLRPMGQASLSCYIGQSFLFAIVFSGWGLGFYNRLTAFELLAVAGCVVLITAILARIWLSFYRQGPLELIVSKMTKKLSN